MRCLYTISLLLIFASQSWATDWYFDKDSISISEGGVACNDTTGTGTKLSPFCSPFNKMYNYTWDAPQAGDRIYLRGGTYTGHVFWFKSGTLNNGTEVNPIIISPYPGESVIFNGLTYPGGVKTYTDYLIHVNTSDTVDGVHFIGPFTAYGYTHALYGAQVTSPNFRKGWKFKDWSISDSGTGLYAATYGNLTIEDITCTDLRKQSTHNMCVGIRGYAGQQSYDITVRRVNASHVYDGRSADARGDADGVWTDNYCANVSFEDIISHDNEEDGVDTKCQNVTMKNIVTYNNGATGVKLWGGNFNRTTTHNVSNILSYNNGETGLKCSGNGDTVNAIIDHLTAYANGEDNIKNVQGYDDDYTGPDGLPGSNACIMTLRNSLLGGGTQYEANLPPPAVDVRSATNHLSYVNITHPSNGYYAITPGSCLSGRYTVQQYLDGLFNTDMTAVQACGAQGSLSGSATAPSSNDPLLVTAPDTFLWSSVATGSITYNTVTMLASSDIIWPSPVTVGHYIEINSDGVRRQITSVDSVAKTIQFSPSVSETVCSSSVNCIGTKVVSYGTDNTSPVVSASLQSTSPVKDAGLYVAGVHCALADDNGGSGLTGCVHWRGTAPDLGYIEYGSGVPQAFRPRARVTTAP